MKLRRVVFLVQILCLTVVYSAGAQPAVGNVYQALDFYAGEPCFVFADTAKVYSRADFQADVVRTYQQGDSLTVYKVDDTVTRKGITAPWIEVTYKTGNAMRKGYLWSGYLSPRRLVAGGVRFVYGMMLTDAGAKLAVALKAVKGDKILAQCQLKFDGADAQHYYHTASVKGNKGLGKFKRLLYFEYSGEACSVPTYEQYVGWDGSHFVPFAQLTSLSEAGAGYTSEKFIFPQDKGGKKEVVILKQESGMFNEKTNKTKVVSTSKKVLKY